MCVCVCVCVCVAKPVAVELRCHATALINKKITFGVRKFQKFCVLFLTLNAFIISEVSIRTQN